MTEVNDLVKITGLCKEVHHRVLLGHISLHIEAGQIYGLLGSDGSGKTQLLKILAGLSRASAGEGSMLGIDYRYRDSVRDGVGYVSETKALYEPMTIRQLIHFTKALSIRWNEQWIQMALSKLGISEAGRIQQLTKSQKGILYVALTMAADPALLLIDEPTEGMDDLHRELLLNLLLDFMESGDKGVCLASRTITEIAGIIDAFGVMKKGRMIYTGNVEETMAKFCKVRLVPKDMDVDLSGLSGLYGLERENRSVLMKLYGHREELVENLSAIPHDFMDVMPMNIHEIYMELLKEDKGLCSFPL